MILCVDSGNSRIKWGLHADGAWRETGAIDHADVAQLAALPQRLPMPANLMMSNVAGEAARLAIRQALVPWLAVLHEIESTASAGGVTNLYENPVRLGVDRWCALIGARAITTAPCVVVMAGTATTVDTLDGDGRFLGGLILPGLELMRRSLARDTAALPLAAGKYSVLSALHRRRHHLGLHRGAGRCHRARLRAPGCGRALPAFRRRGRRYRRASRRAACFSLPIWCWKACCALPENRRQRMPLAKSAVEDCRFSGDNGRQFDSFREVPCSIR